MRAALLTSFLLVSFVALSACGSSKDKAEEQARQQAEEQKAAAEAQQKFNQFCGNPVRFPVSQKCVEVAGPQGAMLRRQSDLTVALWRACSLTPASAETIRQEITARGGANNTVSQQIISGMERAEQNSDSPCVRADLRDLDCVAGNGDACAHARSSDPECAAWMSDPDTQARIKCLQHAVVNSACSQAQPAGYLGAEMRRGTSPTAAGAFSDTQARQEDCRKMENACLHTWDECAQAKDALNQFIKQEQARARAEAAKAKDKDKDKDKDDDK
jgi:hypothetical protein